MSRLLFLAIVVAVVYWLLKSYRKKLPGEDVTGQVEDMVRCVHCGVHLPKHESILAGGKFYCSDAHRRADAGKPE